MLDDIFNMFLQRSGLTSNIARIALPLVLKFLLRNAVPQRESGFMSMLPSSVTNMFSNDEEQRFTSTQENVSEDEVIDQISRECCNGNKEKGRIAYRSLKSIKRENSKTKTTTRARTRRRGDFKIISYSLKGRGGGGGLF